MKKLLSLAICCFIYGISTAQTWSKEETEDFMSTCISEAREFLTKEEARLYCQCTMEKIMLEYPNADDIDQLTEEEISVFVEECILSVVDLDDASYTWTEEVKREFIIGCGEELEGSGLDPKTYCPCALEEVMKLYTNPLDAVNMSDAETIRIAEKCLK